MTHLSRTALLLSLAVALGCRSTGVDQASGTVGAIKTIDAELGQATQGMKDVVSSLNELVAQQGDMKQEFATYTDAVATMQSHATRVRALRQDVEQQRAEFDESWSESMKSITNTTLRERAEERRSRAAAIFDGLKKQADTTKAKFDPWLKDVVDLRTYLEHELNPDGVKSIADVARKVDSGAATIEKDVAAIRKELLEVADAMAAAAPPDPDEAGEKK